MPRKHKLSKNPRKKYPEVRPGVKLCPVCVKEFELGADADKAARGRWPYKRFCTYRCNQVHTARVERARLKGRGLPADYYRKEAKHRINQRKAEESQRPRTGIVSGSGWMNMGIGAKAGGRGILMLEALPPEAKTKSLKQAFYRACAQHNEFGPIMLEEIASR